VAAAVLDEKFGLAQGFQVYDHDLAGAVPQEHLEPLAVYRPGNLVVDRALAWLDDVAGRQPFFCWVHLYDAHSPDIAHPELDGTSYAGIASYDGEIAFADLQLGRLLTFLRARGLESQTLVVVAGDHGEGLGDHGEREHGYLLNDEVLHVPLVVALPGVIDAGQRVDAVVSLVDLFPTVLDITHAGSPARGIGRSLLPALRGEPIPSVPSYAETDMPSIAFRWGALRALTSPGWKYVRSVRPELYDRTADLGERHNLVRRDPGRVAEMETALARFEGGLGTGSARPATLTAEERARLEALGYVDGGPAATEQTPGSHDVKDMLGVKHLRTLLTRALRAGRVSPGRTAHVADKLVRLSPETPQFHQLLGTAYLKLGRADEAAAQLEELVRQTLDAGESFSAFADARVAQGRNDEALALYTRAVELRPDLAEAHFGRGNVLLAKGELDEALGAFAEAVAVRPNFPEADLNMGNIFARRGRPKRAREHYMAALELKPDFALAHHALAMLLARHDRTDKALVHFREAVRLSPTFAPGYYHLARLLAEEGQTDEAIAAYRRAVELAPGNPEYSDNLAAAYSGAGRFADAASAARAALAAARTEGRTTLADDIERRIAFYEQSLSGSPRNEAVN
jgi:tetratricopeptide (TPR) repeat protein